MFFCACVAVWVGQQIARRRILERMQTRQSRNPEMFGRYFFSPEQAPVAAKVREILSHYLSFDLLKLSPEDTFVDFEVAEMDSLATVGFVAELEREFGIRIPNRDAEKLKTFRDVVEYVSSSKNR